MYFIYVYTYPVWLESPKYLPFFLLKTAILIWGFSGGSNSKESAFIVGHPDLIPGSRRSPGEGNGYLLQYSCLETSIDRGAWWATVHGLAKEPDMTEQLTLLLFHSYFLLCISFTMLVIELAIRLHPVTSNSAPGSLTRNTWRGPYCMVWVHSPCYYFQSSMQFCNFQVGLDFGECCHLYCEEMLYALHCSLDRL